MSAITLLQAVGSASGTGAYTSNTTAGSFLVAVVRGTTGGTTLQISDTTNGNWTQAASSADNASQIWFFNGGVGGVKPTVSKSSGNITLVAMVIAEFSGVQAVSPLDQNSAGAGVSAAYSVSPAITTTQAAELLIGGVENVSANGLTNTPATGWTNALSAGLGGNGNAFMNYQVTAAKGTFANIGTMSSSVTWSSTIASFIGATQPSPGPTPVGWSPVDSRVAVNGFGPGANTGIVDSQGNTIYSAQNPPFSGNSQVSDNTAIPPVDSRVSKPVDSRTNKPVNSRVAPPFGEAGEP